MSLSPSPVTSELFVAPVLFWGVGNIVCIYVVKGDITNTVKSRGQPTYVHCTYMYPFERKSCSGSERIRFAMRQ